MRVLSDGRIRRSEDEWRDLLSEFASSGGSESQFCRRKKISRNAFRSWKRRLGAATTSAAPPAFIELDRPEADPRLESGQFELVLPGGVRLRWKA